MGIGDLIGTVIGVAIFAVIVVPIVSMAIVAALTMMGLQFAVVSAMVGYIVGIPGRMVSGHARQVAADLRLTT